jgi:hypothetical protein
MIEAEGYLVMRYCFWKKQQATAILSVPQPGKKGGQDSSDLQKFCGAIRDHEMRFSQVTCCIRTDNMCARVLRDHE